jgi:hypothetical protein
MKEHESTMFQIFFLCRNSPNWARASSESRLSRSHSDTPHSVGLFWTTDRPETERPVPDNTQHSQGRDIHAPRGIQTRNPSKLPAADPRLRRYGQWDRPMFLLSKISLSFKSRYYTKSQMRLSDIYVLAYIQQDLIKNKTLF